MRVFPQEVGALAKEMLHLVVTSGTGKAAQVGDEYIWGKTGTTENYGDAWFVGGNDDMTVAVWVGYPDKVQSMEYEHAGGPVAGGTFPAEIFHDFLTSWLTIRDQRRVTYGQHKQDDETTHRGDAGRAHAAGRPERRPRGRAADRAGARRPRRHGAGGGQGQPDAAPAPEPPTQTPQQPPTPAEPAPTPTQPPDRRQRRWRRDAEHARPARRRSGAPGASAPARGATRAGCPRRRSATAARPPW